MHRNAQIATPAPRHEQADARRLGRFRNPRRKRTLIVKNVAGLHDLLYARRLPAGGAVRHRQGHIVQRVYSICGQCVRSIRGRRRR